MKPRAVAYIRTDLVPGRVEHYKREMRWFLRRMHYYDEVEFVLADGQGDFHLLPEALEKIGSITAAVPDLSHLDGQLPVLGEIANVWETVTEQFWEMLKPQPVGGTS